MNEGFRGSEVGIASVQIQGSEIKVGVQFVSAGSPPRVHATTTHSINALSEENEETLEIRQRAGELLNALQTYITKQHFTDPDGMTSQQKVARGINEALSGQLDEPG